MSAVLNKSMLGESSFPVYRSYIYHQIDMVLIIIYHISRPLPASEKFHLTSVPINVSIGSANRSIHGCLVTVYRTVFPVS